MPLVRIEYDSGYAPVCVDYKQGTGEVFRVPAHKLARWREAEAAYLEAQREMADLLDGRISRAKRKKDRERQAAQTAKTNDIVNTVFGGSR